MNVAMLIIKDLWQGDYSTLRTVESTISNKPIVDHTPEKKTLNLSTTPQNNYVDYTA